jgi:hypothetical protein
MEGRERRQNVLERLVVAVEKQSEECRQRAKQERKAKKAAISHKGTM